MTADGLIEAPFPVDIELYIHRNDVDDNPIYIGDIVKQVNGPFWGEVIFELSTLSYTVAGFYDGSYDYPGLAFSQDAQWKILTNVHKERLNHHVTNE